MSNVALSNLNIGDVDPIQRLGRKSLLQFVAMDYCIQIQTQALAKVIAFWGKRNQDEEKTPTEIANNLLKNPYRMESSAILKLTEISPPNTSTNSRDIPRNDIKKIFKAYLISISMQQILSHVLINTSRVYNLQYVELDNDLPGSSDPDATEDQIDAAYQSYYRNARDNNVKAELESSNEGTPIRGEYEEIILQLVKSIGDFSNDDKENLFQTNSNYIVDEIKNESKLLYMIFPIETVPFRETDKILTFLKQKLSGLEREDIIELLKKELPNLSPQNLNQLSGEFKSILEQISKADVISKADLAEKIKEKLSTLPVEEINLSPQNLTQISDRIVSQLINDLTPEESQEQKQDNLRLEVLVINDQYKTICDTAGLRNVFKVFDDYLPNDITSVMNSDVFSAVLDYWGHLFFESQPIIINTLTTTLPKISDRFVTSVSNSISQQDLRYNCLRLIVDYLQSAIRPIRLDELISLTDNPTAANLLVAFRSLRAKQVVSKTSSELIQVDWDPKKDPTGRIGYMYTCWWTLTSNRELNILFKFAYEIMKTTDGNNNPYDLPADKVIASAVFPGNLDTIDSTQNSKSLIDFDFERDKRRIKIKEEKLKRPGELEKILYKDGGQWLI